MVLSRSINATMGPSKMKSALRKFGLVLTLNSRRVEVGILMSLEYTLGLVHESCDSPRNMVVCVLQETKAITRRERDVVRPLQLLHVAQFEG